MLLESKGAGLFFTRPLVPYLSKFVTVHGLFCMRVKKPIFSSLDIVLFLAFI